MEVALGDLSNILVATGTLALAAVSFYTVRQNSKQLDMLSRQILIQRSSLIPYLEINSLDIQENTLILDIENLSNSTAHGLGISTAFYLVFPRCSADKKGKDILSASRIQQFIEEKKTVWAKYYLYSKNQPKLTWEEKQVKPMEVISFPETGNYANYFPPRHKASLKITPLFYVSTEEELPSGQAFEYEDFRGFLLQNEINYVAVVIKLVYKDSTDVQIGQESVCRFVINPHKHKNIKESWEEKAIFDFLPLSITEIQQKNKWIPANFYEGMKYHWNRSEEEKERLEK